MTFPFVTFCPRGVLANATIAYQTSAADSAGGSAYSFTSQAIGPASSDRIVIVAIYAGIGSSAVASSVVIGGVSAVQLVANTATGTHVSIWAAMISSGTTATISYSLSVAAARSGISIWSTTGLQSLTPTSTATSTAAPLHGSIDIVSGGVTVSVAYVQSAATATWTNITENVDTQTNLEGDSVSVASRADNTAQSSLSVTCSWSASSVPAMALVSLR